MDLKDIGWEDMDWTNSTQSSDKWCDFVNKVMNLEGENVLHGVCLAGQAGRIHGRSGLRL